MDTDTDKEVVEWFLSFVFIRVHPWLNSKTKAIIRASAAAGNSGVGARLKLLKGRTCQYV